MDPEGFPGSFFRTWEPRLPMTNVSNPAVAAAVLQGNINSAGRSEAVRSFEFGFTSGGPFGSRREAKTLDELFKDYGVRLTTLAKMAEMGFTVQTLVNMTDQELEDVIKAMLEVYHIELLVGEKYGIKAAIRAERKHLDDEIDRAKGKSQVRGDKRRRPDVEGNCSREVAGRELQRRGDVSNSSLMIIPDGMGSLALSGSKDPSSVAAQQQQTQFLAAGGNAGNAALAVGVPETGSDSERKRKKKQKRRRSKDENGEDGEDRPREHPFIVTEPGELARGKKNGLDYLFDLYEQCGKYLEEVQQQCKERGEKCPTKVTNQVFRHAKHRGASYINKPKMRHYVHCYALHCLDMDQSNHLRKLFKDRGENVGAWRQACYYPLVEMARGLNWDIEGVFNRNEKLRIWYVPTRLRQLCHIEKGKDSCQ